MDAFLISSYGYDPAALPYLAAGSLAVAMGSGLLLYERFTPASRHFFAMSTVMAGWLLAYGASFMADPSHLRELWYRVGLALTAVQMPVLYALTIQLAGRRRPRVLLATWGGSVVMMGLSAGLVSPGIDRLMAGSPLSWPGPIAVAYVAYVITILALVIHEFWAGYRAARTSAEQRRHLLMLAAIAVAGLGLMDFFIPPESNLRSGISPLLMIPSLALMGVAGTRYRMFALSAKFATDEVLRAMGDAVLVCDGRGIIRVANAEAQRLLETSEAVLLGSHVSRWLRDEEGGEGPVRPGVSVSGMELVRDRQMLLQQEGGPAVEASVSIEPITAGGDRRGLVIVARDIRDRRRAERALRAAERRYKSLFWHNPGPAYEVGVDGGLVAVNPAAERLIGATADDLVGRSFMDVIAPVDQEKAAGLFESVLSGESREFEMTVQTMAGEPRVLRGVSIPVMDDGEIAGVFGVTHEITEAARAKRELEVQRRYFADLFESSPEALVLVAPQSDEVLRVNGEFTRIFGYSAEEAVGRNLNDLIVPDDRKAEGNELNAVARDTGRVLTETVRRHRDGSQVEVSLLARKLVIPGEPEQLYGVYRDIGDRKETERRLRQSEEELRHAQKLEAVGKLAGGVAHDFNNLLTVINGHTRLALEGIEPQHPVEQNLQEIERAGTRAASLTQQLLAYSRRQVLHPKQLDPNAVMAEIKDMLGRLIGEQISLETRFTPEEVWVRADRGQLEQVLVNLVVNARDAMPEGGVLSLETDVMHLEPGDPRIEHWEVSPGPFVRLRVADTGVGMDPETLERAFEPFFTTKAQGKGTGLGLATVIGIVKQSGGHVTVSSTPGAGTVFDVILPQAEPQGTSSDERPSARPRQHTGGVVLVVEDEAAVRKLAVRVLEREGYTVYAADDGLRALEVLDGLEDGVDLVVTDVVMPGMGGRELLDHLRRRDPDLPVLLMSGYDEELVVDGRAESELLAKPFTPAALAEHVGEVIRSSRS